MTRADDKSADKDIDDDMLREFGMAYRLLFENISDAIFVADCSTRMLIDCNRKALELTGYSRGEILRMKADQLHPPDVLQQTMEYFAKYAANEGVSSFESAIVSKTGNRIPISINACLTKTKGLNCLIGIFRNITAQKQAEEKLKESQEQLKTLINTMPDIVCFKDGQGRWLEANDFDLKLFELYGKVDYRGKKDSELADHSEFYRQAFLTCEQTDERTWQAGVPVRSDEIIPRPDGTSMTFDIIKIPTFTHDGQRKGLIVVGRDITDKKRAEEEQRRLKNILDSAIEQTPVPMALASVPDGTLLYVNHAAKVFLGIEDEEDFQGKPLLKFKQSWKDYNIIGQHLPITQMPLALAMSGKKTISQEYSVVTKQGHRRFELVTAMPIYGDEGKQIAAFVVFPDITDLKIAEESLRKSRQQFERQALFLDALMAAIPVPVFYKDAEGKYLGCNDAYSEIMGVSREDIKGKTVFDLWPAELAQIYHEKDMELLRNPTIHIYEAKIKNKDGELRDVIFRKGVFRNENGALAGIIGAHFDITERKQAEEALKKSESQFRALAESAQDIIYRMSIPDGNYEYISPAIKTIIEYGPEEFYADPSLTRRTFHPAWQDYFDREWQKILEGKMPPTYEYQAITKSGQIKWLMQRNSYLYNSAGEKIAVQGIVTDITERKQSEEQKLQMERQMLHVQKLESLGILAGGMAHDFNNILMAILGYADLTLMQMSPTSPGRENLQEIVQASHKAANLCSQMLAYSGRGKFVVGSIQINTLVSEMAHLLKAAISKKISLNLNLQKNLPPIEGDATQIHQVVMNLITNASEAIGDAEGTIRFSTGTMLCTKNDFADAILANDVVEGQHVYLEVSDTGCGMDKTTINRIFEPFFTTKFTGRGLGMAAVLGIIRGHKGAIKIISEIGKGTTFQVFFPVIDQPQSTISPTVGDAAKVWKGSGTILLVDDEEYVQKVGKKMVENAGFSVMSAMNGKDAIDIYRQQMDKISLIILDLTMPVMNGQETYELLLRINPSVKVILASGYTEYEIPARFGDHPPAGFLQKPFTSEKLTTLIKSVLEKDKR